MGMILSTAGWMRARLIDSSSAKSGYVEGAEVAVTHCTVASEVDGAELVGRKDT